MNKHFRLYDNIIIFNFSLFVSCSSRVKKYNFHITELVHIYWYDDSGIFLVHNLYRVEKVFLFLVLLVESKILARFLLNISHSMCSFLAHGKIYFFPLHKEGKKIGSLWTENFFTAHWRRMCFYTHAWCKWNLVPFINFKLKKEAFNLFYIMKKLISKNMRSLKLVLVTFLLFPTITDEFIWKPTFFCSRSVVFHSTYSSRVLNVAQYLCFCCYISFLEEAQKFLPEGLKNELLLW